MLPPFGLSISPAGLLTEYSMDESSLEEALNDLYSILNIDHTEGDRSPEALIANIAKDLNVAPCCRHGAGSHGQPRGKAYA